MHVIERLFQFWEINYYTYPLLLIAEFIALIAIIRYKENSNTKKLFFVYVLVEFLLAITDNFLLIAPKSSFKFVYYFLNITNPIISLLELAAYFYYFRIFFKSRKIRNLLLTLFSIYFLIILAFLLTGFKFISPRLNYISNIVSVIEFCFLLPPCFFYFLKIMNSHSEMKLFKRPSFWIVTGIFFNSIISIPHYLIGPFYISNNFENRNILVAIFLYFPYAINFILLSKAFLCKKTLMI